MFHTVKVPEFELNEALAHVDEVL